MEKRYYRLNEVATIFSTSRETVRRWCVNGEIENVNKGGSYYIPVESVEPHQSGLKSRAIIALEKENSKLQKRIEVLEKKMRIAAGTLLEGEII